MLKHVSRLDDVVAVLDVEVRIVWQRVLYHSNIALPFESDFLTSEDVSEIADGGALEVWQEESSYKQDTAERAKIREINCHYLGNADEKRHLRS